jgi:calcineurin-like phosphoesterase family protein
MQKSLVKAWNEKVNDNDIVYHLGNFAWDIISAESALLNLNGIINFMPSSYDSALLETVSVFDRVKVINNGVYTVESLDCVFSPWPMKTWPGKKYGSIHVHGGDKRYKAQLHKEFRFNSNCDLWSYAPVSIESLKEVIDMAQHQE